MATTGYTCYRKESAAGFKHGNGVRKQRQDWSVGQSVTIGFVRDLTVTGKDAEGFFQLVSKAGVEYGFKPHGGLFRA